MGNKIFLEPNWKRWEIYKWAIKGWFAILPWVNCGLVQWLFFLTIFITEQPKDNELKIKTLTIT